MKRLVYPGLIFLTVLLLAGCVKRELELPEGQTVRIGFDWSELADTQNKPSSLQLRFYGPEGNFLFVRTSAPDRFESHLPEGKYKILIYTPDTAGIGYEHMDTFGEAQITVPAQQTGEVSPDNPPNIYGTSVGNLSVVNGHAADTTVTVRPYLHQVSVQLKITGSNKEVAECSAMIGGLAQAMNLSAGIPVLGTQTSVTANLNPQNGIYLGTFLLTGNDDRYPSVISFKIRFNDGTERIIRQNFDDVMKKIDEGPGDVPLSLELTIDVQSIDGVFTATLTEWIYRQGDIILNEPVPERKKY